MPIHEAGSLQTLSVKQHPVSYYSRRSPAARAAVICLHGLASNATRWYEYLSHSELHSDCHLMAMDLRGHGRSLTYTHYSRDDWCTDLGAVMHQNDLPTFLIGHSMGAQIALDYASQQPQQLAGLVLIDPVFPQALTGLLRKVARFRLLIRIGAAILRQFAKLGLHKRQYPYRDLHQLDLDTRTFLAANPDKEIADLYMNPFTDLEYIPLVNYLQDLYEVTRPLADLRSVTTPVLVLLSAGASTSHADTNREILSALPDHTIQTIDADHWLLTERPQQAREAIDGWIRKRIAELE